MDTLYWQCPNLFTYLLGQKNLGEPFLDPLYKRPLFPAETLRQWGSLQPHPLQHLLLQDTGKKRQSDIRDYLNDTHCPFRLNKDTVISDEKKGGGGGEEDNHKTISMNIFRFSKLCDKLKLVFMAPYFCSPSLYVLIF